MAISGCQKLADYVRLPTVSDTCSCIGSIITYIP